MDVVDVEEGELYGRREVGQRGQDSIEMHYRPTMDDDFQTQAQAAPSPHVAE